MMKTRTPTQREDLAQKITDQVIEALEAGVRPWAQSWAGSIRLPRRHNGARYQGINILALWMTAGAKGYSSPYWMTFKQALAIGACVRKGEKGAQVVYADRIVKRKENAAGEEQSRVIPFLKAYTVFNAEQIEGVPAHYLVQPVSPAPFEPIEAAEAYFSHIPADVRHLGAQPCYIPSLDAIHMPRPEVFATPAAYYSIRAHETVHWSGSASRLDRNLTGRFGDASYCMEELVAEMGAAFVAAALEIGTEESIREDHAPYLAGWLRKLREDKRAIFTAAAKASEALAYLDGFQPQAEATQDSEGEADAEEMERAA